MSMTEKQEGDLVKLLKMFLPGLPTDTILKTLREQAAQIEGMDPKTFQEHLSKMVQDLRNK